MEIQTETETHEHTNPHAGVQMPYMFCYSCCCNAVASRPFIVLIMTYMMSSSNAGSTGGIQSQALLWVLRNQVIKRHETDHMYNQDNSCGCTIYYKAAIKINQLAFMNAINKATAHLNFHKDTQCVPVDRDTQLFDYNMDRVMQIEEI